MKTTLQVLIIFLSLASGTTSLSQVTAIPDANFEQALIDLGIDSDGTINAQVLTTDIQSITNLNVAAYNINDLTGLEGFDALTNLYANENNITSIDFSQNLNLKIINLEENLLNSINVSMLSDLVTIAITDNQIDTLDLSNNPNMVGIYCSGNNMDELIIPPLTNLEQLYCSLNNIDSLDLSSSPSIDKLYCDNNELTYLNLKHGGSSYIEFFSAEDNPNLTCILVNNVTQAQSCCSSDIPAGCVFSVDCVLSNPEGDIQNYAVYPNPTTDQIRITANTAFSFEFYSSIGVLVLDGSELSGTTQLSLESFPSGVYILKINSIDNTTIHYQKVIKS